MPIETVPVKATRAQVELLVEMVGRLESAIQRGRSDKWCLTLWRKFILARDGHKCIACGNPEHLHAHHIFRRASLPVLRFQTGNGITLCERCHRIPHEIWNGRPLRGEPLNWRGGEDLDMIVDAYFALELDGRDRGVLRDDFYFISDEALAGFRGIQGLPPETLASENKVLRITKARMIWEGAPVSGYAQLARAIGRAFLDPKADVFEVLEEELRLQIN